MTSDPGWELPSPDDGSPPPETLQWVEQQLGVAVVDLEPLVGGLSSAIHRLRLSSAVDAAKGHDRVVLRRHTNHAWMEREPYIPHHEARTLQLIGELDLGVDVPNLIAADPDGSFCDVPTIIMTEVGGRPEINPDDPLAYAEQLAVCLAGIHQAPVPDDLELYRRWDNPEAPIPVWVTDRAQWQTAQDRIAGDLPRGTAAFLHRDYHSNNIHWINGEICAVVDWLSACVGPVEADMAHCRWNLAILFNIEAAEHFTTHYSNVTGHTSEPDKTGLDTLTAYDLSVILSAPIGKFPTYGWNALGRSDLTSDNVPPRIESWLTHILNG